MEASNQLGCWTVTNPEPAGPSSLAANKRTLRLGIFGGTFDPPHNGHLHVARQVKTRLNLDAVALMVTNISWQKQNVRQVTSAELRWQLVQAACHGEEGIEPCRLEINRGGESYSVETIQELQRTYPGVELFFILGHDAAMKLPTWHMWEQILESTQLIVVNRPEPTEGPEQSHATTVEQLTNVLGSRFTYLEIPPLEISSTDLRDRFRSQESTELMTTQAVRQLVQEFGLYQNSEAAE